MTSKHIVFGLSGSIACFKACQVISTLTQKGFYVQTIATKCALEFIGKATLEGLTGKKVLSDMYEDGLQMQHISILENASTLIICPATCSIVNKIANGMCDSLLASIFIANNFKIPTIIIPAMNTGMLEYPATQNSLKFLKDKGAIIELGSGHLACGQYGIGRMPEPDTIVQKIIEHENINNNRCNKRKN